LLSIFILIRRLGLYPANSKSLFGLGPILAVDLACASLSAQVGRRLKTVQSIIAHRQMGALRCPLRIRVSGTNQKPQTLAGVARAYFAATPVGDTLAHGPPVTPPGPPNEKPQPAFRFWPGPLMRDLLSNRNKSPSHVTARIGSPAPARGSQVHH
jgi:hypothetical protein